MTSHNDNKAASPAGSRVHPDKPLWMIWCVMVLMTVIALPFIVRQSAVIQAFADICITTLSAVR
jgi:hypothetical protein